MACPPGGIAVVAEAVDEDGQVADREHDKDAGREDERGRCALPQPETGHDRGVESMADIGADPVSVLAPLGRDRARAAGVEIVKER